MAAMVAKNVAVYEPPKQAHAVMLFWRLPEEWADVLHSWVRSQVPLMAVRFSVLSYTGNSDWSTQYHPHFL
jgi:hypothetical protein